MSRLSQHGQLGVEVVLLGHDAEAGADLRAVACRIHAEHAQLAARSPATRSRSCAWSSVLPAPFGPRKPNASPGSTAKSMPSTATNDAEPLGEAATLDLQM